MKNMIEYLNIKDEKARLEKHRFSEKMKSIVNPLTHGGKESRLTAESIGIDTFKKDENSPSLLKSNVNSFRETELPKFLKSPFSSKRDKIQTNNNPTLSQIVI
jgi:hypothetical protein